MSPAEHFKRGTLFVVIGANCVECGVLDGSGWIPESLCKVGIDPMPDSDAATMQAVSALLDQLQSALVPRPTTPTDSPLVVRQVRAVVSDRWLSTSGVPWSTDLAQPERAAAFARGQLALAGFTLATDDRVLLDDAPFGQPRLAVAYPAAVLQALDALASRLGARLASVLPMSMAAWAGMKPARSKHPGAMAVLDDELLLIGTGADHMTDVAVRMDSAWDAQALLNHWQRMRLRDSRLGRVERLPVLNLTDRVIGGNDPGELAPVDWPPASSDSAAVSGRLRLAAMMQSHRMAIDAVPPLASMTPPKWGVVALSMLLVGALSVQAWHTSERSKAAADQLGALQRSAQPPLRSTNWSREDRARAQAVGMAVRELNLPVAELLQALQPPRDIRVAVLNIDLAGAPAKPDDVASVKIVAEARTGAEMARYVGFVAEHKPFIGASLMRHEIVESIPERPYRFTMEAQWQEREPK